jgi:hypothetical protein
VRFLPALAAGVAGALVAVGTLLGG